MLPLLFTSIHRTLATPTPTPKPTTTTLCRHAETKNTSLAFF